MKTLILLVIGLVVVGAAVRLDGQVPKPKPKSSTPPPPCRTGCVGVSVTPDNSPLQNTSSTTDTVQFDVLNTGTISNTYTLTCAASGGITCVSVIPTSMTLSAGVDNNAEVIYTVGTTGGTVSLTASGGGAVDSGWYAISAAAQAAPIVALRNYNPDHRDRSLCLTAAAGESAAFQCGDLLVTHALPDYHTVGHNRAVSLLYSSAQAWPMPAVAVAVTEGGAIAPPNSVFVRLSINGTARDSASYTPWSAAPLTRQIVLAVSDTIDTTGIYPFSILVRNKYSTANKDTTLAGNLIIVSRLNSSFGRGWSLVGVEQLRLAQGAGRILWVGGDGSAVEYDSVAPGAWRATAGAFRDTIKYSSTDTTYTRYLRHGVKVVFDVAGRHKKTISRTGQVAQMFWTTSSNRLDSISVPPAVMPNTVYRFAYDGNAKLDKITDPAGRVLDATVVSNRLTTLQDPDTVSTGFGYDTHGRMTSRTNRAGYKTLFLYTLGFRLDTVKVPDGRTVADTALRAVTGFRPWDEAGFASGTTGQTAVDTGVSYTQIDGPRTDAGDVSEFWIDRWGAPTRIQDPLGNVTTILRGDPHNPALATRVQYPTGRVMLSTYDSLRGNTLTETDSTHQGSDTTTYTPATTSYTYGLTSVPDSPTKILTATHDSTLIAYDTTLGSPTVATAPGGHHTVFTYFVGGWRNGMLHTMAEDSVKVVDTVAWTKSLQNLTTRFEYDTLGNDTLLVAPKGGTIRYVRDASARVRTVYDPRQHQVDYTYSAINRLLTLSIHEVLPTSATLTSQYHYTPTGQLDKVTDPRGIIVQSWTDVIADLKLHRIAG